MFSMAEMSQFIHDSSFEPRIQYKITRINYEPIDFLYNDEVGFCIKWGVKNYYMATRILEGPFPAEEIVEDFVRKKQRYQITCWPELCFTYNKDDTNFFEECMKEDISHYFYYSNPTNDNNKKPNEEEKEENIFRARLMYDLDELPSEPADYLEKLGELATLIFVRMSRYPESKNKSQFRILLKADDCERSDEVKEIQKCLQLVNERMAVLYLSSHVSWCLSAKDIKNPFWKLVQKILGYKKLILTLLTCDLDEDEYLTSKNMREEEGLIKADIMKHYLCDERTL